MGLATTTLGGSIVALWLMYELLEGLFGKDFFAITNGWAWFFMILAGIVGGICGFILDLLYK